MVLACFLAAAVLYVSIERVVQRDLLGSALLVLSTTETAMIVATTLATTWLPLLAFLIPAGACLSANRRKAGFVVLLAGLIVVHTLVLNDVLLYKTFGLHVLDLIAFAKLPRRWEVAGSVGQWAWLVAVSLLTVATVSAAILVGARRLVGVSLRKASHHFQLFVAALISVLYLAGALIPHELANFWPRPVLRERHYGLLAFDARRDGLSDITADDPVVGKLWQSMQHQYDRYFPMLFAPKPAEPDVRISRRDPPNIILIVFESFRHTAVSDELMPKMSAWARRGLRARQHYAGSIYSEAGLFSLLYGRGPLVFHSTLDGHVPPTMCQVLSRSGYETAYYSGHPKEWMRREAYINPDTFDRFEHDDRGNWNEWDRRALTKMVESANSNRERPLFALVFLMSSHFEYQYPPEYEKYTPVNRDARWTATDVTLLGAEGRLPMLNRYNNTVAYLDDEVMRAIDALDAERNLVIVTGDHGESIYDDGRYGHGYAFSDIVARVPFAMVGHGIQPRELESLTLHADLLPTVLHAIEGRPLELAHTHGMSMLNPVGERATLLAHCSVNRDRASAVLLAGGHRVGLMFDLRKPLLKLQGLEDSEGRFLPDQRLDDDAIRGLLSAFDSELDATRR
ncbi:MAG: sulfatase-like hydrolase/transferase [Polyangiaceae bacterium]|jgi:hypothetical protein|nr:sulfatase-like hydrolase/transferase [Polyangiaceae bacterium]